MVSSVIKYKEFSLCYVATSEKTKTEHLGK